MEWNVCVGRTLLFFTRSTVFCRVCVRTLCLPEWEQSLGADEHFTTPSAAHLRLTLQQDEVNLPFLLSWWYRRSCYPAVRELTQKIVEWPGWARRSVFLVLLHCKAEQEHLNKFGTWWVSMVNRKCESHRNLVISELGAHVPPPVQSDLFPRVYWEPALNFKMKKIK